MNQTFAACKHFFQFHILLLIPPFQPASAPLHFPAL